MMTPRINDASVNEFAFACALELVRRSGAVERIERWNQEDCNVRQVPFQVRVVLVVMQLLIAENEQIHWRQAALLLGVRMSDQQLRELGAYDAVDHEDRKLLRRHARYRCEAPDRVRKAQDRMYMAFKRSVDALLEPVDGSPFKGMRRRRMATAEVMRIRKTMTEAHHAKYDRLHELLNLLVRASVPVLPQGWTGSLILDTTIIPVGRRTQKYFGPEKLHGPDPDSDWTTLDRYFPGSNTDETNCMHGAYAYGMTIAKTMAMPELDGVSLAVALAWHQPNGGTTAGGLAAIDGGRASGAIAPQTAKHKDKYRTVVTDMGFSDKLDFKPGAHARGYEAIHNYRKMDINKTTDIGHGVVLFRGAPVCPGAHSLIDEYQKLASKGVDHDTRQAKLAEIEKFTMVRRGLPQPKQDRPPGRPRKDAPTTVETKHSVTFRCPAAAGRVFCALACSDLDEGDARLADVARKEQIAHDQGMLIMPTPPTPSTAPAVCEQDSLTFSLDDYQYKRWQVAMVGTQKHEELGKGGRAADEAFHGFMKSGSGAQFREDRFLIVNGTAIAIFGAMVVASVNQSLLEAHDLHTPMTPPEDEAA
ncbi:hypothetical protein [Ornithinimicrobium cryptoxanthini]|uniref:hypothetical protein n=1 Tax=Ornithinimicrobium cryptoxanthini TaxID=2934161 RepID=UPI0021196D70|nr:hypothetical protein [Ornithinimicrobium cryptoxanthini]